MKKNMFRHLFLVSILVTLVCTFPNHSWAVEKKYPTGPIDLFVGFAAGGQADFINRTLARGLEKYLGVTVVPGNKVGGGGIVLASLVASSRPDGYTLGTLSDSVIVATLTGQGTYKMEDLHIVGVVASYENCWVTSIDSPWKTIEEFVDYARKNPGVKYAHPGVGSVTHIYTENISRNANLNLTNVPFKGDPEINAAVLGKHVPIAAYAYSSGKIQTDAGKTRMLLCYNGLDPTIPSISKVFGKSVPTFDLVFFLAVPGKTPDETVRVLEQAIEKVSKDPEYVNTLRKNNVWPLFVDSKTCTQKTIPEKISILKGVMQPLGLMK
jgi:tripartite-type tricarboxylate transporter receptor subunit TctC